MIWNFEHLDSWTRKRAKECACAPYFARLADSDPGQPWRGTRKSFQMEIHQTAMGIKKHDFIAIPEDVMTAPGFMADIWAPSLLDHALEDPVLARATSEALLQKAVSSEIFHQKMKRDLPPLVNEWMVAARVRKANGQDGSDIDSGVLDSLTERLMSDPRNPLAEKVFNTNADGGPLNTTGSVVRGAHALVMRSWDHVRGDTSGVRIVDDTGDNFLGIYLMDAAAAQRQGVPLEMADVKRLNNLIADFTNRRKLCP